MPVDAPAAMDRKDVDGSDGPEVQDSTVGVGEGSPCGWMVGEEVFGFGVGREYLPTLP